ncbi:MAG TPA: sigma-E processing peptidase SpoIIGA [Candidatus Eisenbergiella merdigallinarum]|uniref:Sigma-E processing peptidase SpoIIGA n=1 Tax=Candidatus Eisenbergiella merdigallinarum TaxID=2838552 RepID=A0A9D2MQ56_9FIRM|nr:sigma-E processing peptidase SpoIIGA [Candidatus Eisenbergiella merdigallinarum]
MEYEVYIDRLFFLHFGMNFLLLMLTDRLGDYRVSKKRLALTAAVASALYLAVLLWPVGRFSGGLRGAGALKVLLFSAGTLGALAAAFSLRQKRELLSAAGLYAACSCLLGGTLSALQGAGRALWGGKEVSSVTVLGVLAPALVASLAGCALWRREQKKRSDPLWRVRLKEGETTVEVVALADSGNSLTDPCTHRPVCVADRAVLRALGVLEKPERFRIIPYHSVGKGRGLLQAAAVEEMRLYRAGQERVQKRVLIAVSQEKLSQSGSWQMLLHPAILEEEKGEDHDIESSDAGKDAV